MASSPAIDNLLGRVKGADGISRLGGKDEEVEEWLSEAAEINPTTDPGDWADDNKAKNLAEGVWEVAYAPHIHTMQKILGVEFAPIRYSLYARPGGGRVMISNVHYKGPIVGEGWLNTAGGWVSLDKKTVRVTWSKFWWDAGASLEAGPSAAPEGDAVGLVQVPNRPWTPTLNSLRVSPNGDEIARSLLCLLTIPWLPGALSTALNGLILHEFRGLTHVGRVPHSCRLWLRHIDY
jgi:hypothetical protein